ncbi:hypothetical protein [Corynebacterium ulcerans]|nr:hypothetical protein [Corynebacterium ulcerans]NOL59008.1 hypothetical protein [Corynebacterium ulcerans]NOM02506.1 hypothetical protein [Corynebacterium ulcerans]
MTNVFGWVLIARRIALAWAAHEHKHYTEATPIQGITGAHESYYCSDI